MHQVNSSLHKVDLALHVISFYSFTSTLHYGCILLTFFTFWGYSTAKKIPMSQVFDSLVLLPPNDIVKPLSRTLKSPQPLRNCHLRGIPQTRLDLLRRLTQSIVLSGSRTLMRMALAMTRLNSFRLTMVLTMAVAMEGLRIMALLYNFLQTFTKRWQFYNHG